VGSKIKSWQYSLFFTIIGVYYLKPTGSQSETHRASHDKEVNAACLEPKFVGPCRAAMPRFYYNQEAKSCEQFIYGGCSANGNNFQEKTECERTCMGHHSQGSEEF
jgi:hypothetical protein